MSVFQEPRGVGNGKLLIHGVSFSGDENVTELYSCVWLHNILNVLNTTELF